MPITTISDTEARTPGLLLSEIDQRVVRVRPSATPLDQISRMGNFRKAGSMKVEYYSVDTKPISAVVESHTAPAKAADPSQMKLAGNNASLLEQSETFLVPSARDSAGNPAVFYVLETDKTSGMVKVVHANAADFQAAVQLKGRSIVRMGRAATELDVQTPQFQALPRKDWNVCQIFKAQVEESTLHRLTNKEVGWTFSDQEEVAVIDMRLGMEKNFLFGCRAVITDPAKGEDVSLTGGIWNQTSHTFAYDMADDAENIALDLVRQAFSGNTGSRRKILIAGSDLIDKLNRQPLTRNASASDTVTKWGIDFTEICSKFGRLYVVHSEIFDQCGAPGNGMVIDPDYITKYSFIPMQAERLQLKSSGQRNTDAIVITEASCLVLRHPDAHLRVVAE